MSQLLKIAIQIKFGLIVLVVDLVLQLFLQIKSLLVN